MKSRSRAGWNLPGRVGSVRSRVRRQQGPEFTGKVSDAMCGKAHMMSGSDAACTRACVAKGSKYALVVGDKVYTLDASDKATLSSLDNWPAATPKSPAP